MGKFNEILKENVYKNFIFFILVSILSKNKIN